MNAFGDSNDCGNGCIVAFAAATEQSPAVAVDLGRAGILALIFRSMSVAACGLATSEVTKWLLMVMSRLLRVSSDAVWILADVS